MPANGKLGTELSKVLFREEPLLLACDVEASLRAALEVSNLLGCIMATVLKRCGEAAYMQAFDVAMTQVHAAALSTVNKAERAAPNTTQH